MLLMHKTRRLHARLRISRSLSCYLNEMRLSTSRAKRLKNVCLCVVCVCVCLFVCLITFMRVRVSCGCMCVCLAVWE